MSATKIGKKTTIILKLLFFTINLHFVTSKQISTYKKLNLPLISSICFVFLLLEMQKRLKQTKLYHTFCYFAWKETTYKPLKVEAAKTFFSSVCVCVRVIGTTGKHYFFMKVYFYSEIFLALYCCFLWSQCFVLKEVHILCVISTITTWCYYKSSKIKLIQFQIFLYKWNFS